MNPDPMATNPSAIPESDRYGGLKQFLFTYVDTIVALRSAHPNLSKLGLSIYQYLSFPWIVDDRALTTQQRISIDRGKSEGVQLGFDGDRARKELEGILSTDRHLAECCPTLIQLATYLDTAFIGPVAEAIRSGAPKERKDFAYDEFVIQTYQQGRFRRIALSHLFNFDTNGNSIALEGFDDAVGSIRIERIDPNTIPKILGESGFQAFLHPIEAGNCFVVEEEAASTLNDDQWLSSKRSKAYYFAELLQYFKDGVVHLGYSVPFFLPAWAHQIRRVGLFFLGEPRRTAYEGGKRPYFLDDAERDDFRLWWKAATMPKTLEAFANKKGKLRQATYRAARYYEVSHERSDVIERLVAVAIGMESLFSPSDQGELSFRISQTAAQFIGKDGNERREIFGSLRDMYSRRSKLLHGAYDIEKYEAGKFVTADEIDRWASYLRRAYLGFITIYLRNYLSGANEEARESLLERINEANFDSAKGDMLREESDIKKLLDQVNPNG